MTRHTAERLATVLLLAVIAAAPLAATPEAPVDELDAPEASESTPFAAAPETPADALEILQDAPVYGLSLGLGIEINNAATLGEKGPSLGALFAAEDRLSRYFALDFHASASTLLSRFSDFGTKDIFLSLEALLYLRFYPFAPKKLGPSHVEFFVGAGGGVIATLDGLNFHNSRGSPEVGGIAGARFSLGSRFYLEPYVRASFQPVLFAAGITAGLPLSRPPAGGVFTRGYTVTAQNETQKTCEVTAMEGVIPIVRNLQESLDWVKANAVDGGEYIIPVHWDEEIGPNTLDYGGKTVHVVLVSDDSTERTVSLSKKGLLFTVGNKATLTLNSGVTLQVRIDNNAELVRVSTGGALVMNNGSKMIVGENFTDVQHINDIGAGGVSVASGATFTMNGGEIYGNNIHRAGSGVYVDSGAFTMNGGTISGFTADWGGGVRVSSGIFTMNDGTISGNSSTTGSGGGGVCMIGGILRMNGGLISGNNSQSGGGLYIRDGATFMMISGEISDNHANYGGGVVITGSTFTMSGGTISGNITTSYGGGVYAAGGTTFTMNGGTISGNYSGDGGGGVHVWDSYSITFTKSGGTIYGSDADDDLRNTASNNQGHAVYVRYEVRKLDTTAGEDVTLDSSVNGPDGGWEL